MLTATVQDMPMKSTVNILPADEHNLALVANVHPPDWVNPEPSGRYNLVVIGAGPAGLVAAVGAAGLGAKVALIEKHLLGGDCLNVGCVPSKALIRAARAAAGVRDAGQFGVSVPEGAGVDFAAVMERMRKLRADISRHDSATRFRETGIDVFLGEGRFEGRDIIRVGDRTLRFRKALIATGARATGVPIPGIEDTGYLTNETLFSLTELPRRLAVIGAGPIGCEMAQAFARFGSQVTLLEAMRQILPREDRDAAEIVERALKRDGVDVNCCSHITGVRENGIDKILTLENEDGRKNELCVDEILLSVGRAPNVDGLNLESVGVDYDKRSGITVDDRLRTTNPRIFAAGDVCFPLKFTHSADFQARIVIQNALFKGRAKAGRLTIPWCTYTDPEIAHVGLHEQNAEFPVQTFIQPLDDVDRAILDGETEGFVKVHVKRGTDKIVGATIVASHAGDLISQITQAMTAGTGLKQIGSTIHPYPTQAEAIRKLGDQFNRTRLTPFVKRLFKMWLSWTR